MRKANYQGFVLTLFKKLYKTKAFLKIVPINLIFLHFYRYEMVFLLLWSGKSYCDYTYKQRESSFL